MLLNRGRAEKVMAKNDLDGLIATSAANVFYTSDLCPYGKPLVLLPCDRKIDPAIIASLSGSTPIVLNSPPWIKDVRYYGEFYIEKQYAKEPLTDSEQKYMKAVESWERLREEDPIAMLISLLKERGIKKGKIGVDESNFPLEHPFWQRIKKDLPELEAVRAQHIFKEIRMVKTDEEIRRIQEALRITEKAWEAALKEAKEGMTEEEFAKIYDKTIIDEGGRVSTKQGFFGPPIAFGHNTAFVDVAYPSNYKLKKGDLIRFDGGAAYMGYPSDTARCAVLGKPSEKLRKYFDAISAGELLAINMAKPGVKASEIFNAVVKKVREAGIPHFKRHHVGHGWGIEGYDPPLMTSKDQTPLEEGMVLDFETPYYEIGWGGMLNEDVIVVTKKDPRFLTKFSRELYII